MNTMKRGDQRRIAEATGYSPSFICDIFKGRTRPPADLAEHLEREYGVDRRAWYWPDQFPNPLLPPPQEQPQDAA